jgi:hypothetical protein
LQRDLAYRFAAGLALAAAFLIVWLNIAACLIGIENDDPRQPAVCRGRSGGWTARSGLEILPHVIGSKGYSGVVRRRGSDRCIRSDARTSVLRGGAS